MYVGDMALIVLLIRYPGQKKLIYILTAVNIANCLATIISRCQVIETQKTISETQKGMIKTKEFLGMSVGQKLNLTSKITNREEATEFITNLIYDAHSLFIKGENLSNFLENANKTLSNLKANGNTQLQLTNFVINLEN